MKKNLALVLFVFLSGKLFSQFPDIPPCNADTAQKRIFSWGHVHQQKEWSIDNKSGAKTFRALREYNKNGCLTKAVYEEVNGSGGKYSQNVWEFDEKGNTIRTA